MAENQDRGPIPEISGSAPIPGRGNSGHTDTGRPKLDDRLVRDLQPPAAGNRVVYDAGKDAVRGFGVRVTAAGSRAFVLNFRAAGRERRLTIGSYPDWSVKQARDRAAQLKRRIDVGEDPMGERHAERTAPSMDDLAGRFEAEHLSKRRAATQTDYRSILRLYIRPQLGKMKVAEVRHADIERLHHRIAEKAPYRANRTVAVLSKMFALAVKWEMRPDNPARAIERKPEERRERFLTPGEIGRLAEVLAEHPERASANAVRLLLLTGARRGEVLGARWDQIDFRTRTWTKPSASTKQGKTHHLPLGAAALALLTEMRAEADRENVRRAKYGLPPIPYLFPGKGGKPLREIKRSWAALCSKAQITGARIHDLRHTYASILASHGFSLPLIGAMLGHSQPATTNRYAHLMDDPLRLAAERVGQVVTGAGKEGAEVVDLSGRKRA